jgi:hypothetical protein
MLNRVRKWIAKLMGRFWSKPAPSTRPGDIVLEPPAPSPVVVTYHSDSVSPTYNEASGRVTYHSTKAYSAPRDKVGPPEPKDILGHDLNRSERRKYERLRRKHDKFVTPKGTPPEVHHRDPKDDDGLSQSSPSPPELPELEAAPVPIPENVIDADAGGKPVEGGTWARLSDDEDGNWLILHPHTDDEGNDKAEMVLYEEGEFQGRFTFRDTILDQLDRYWVYLERMKRHDWDAFVFYRQVGALLKPYSATADYWKTNEQRQWSNTHFRMQLKDCKTQLPPWFMQTLPGFGCVAHGVSPFAEKIEMMPGINGNASIYTPKFMYFTRFERPLKDVQIMSNGHYYKLTTWWDRPQDPDAKRRGKYGTPQDTALFVRNDGKVFALKTYSRHWHQKNGKWHKDYWREWSIDPTLQDWAKQHGLSAQHYLVHLFVDMIDQYSSLGESMVQVSVSRGEDRAIFMVEEKRLPYFFSDRDYVLTPGGQRERIFHLVKPHQRSDGAFVKMHFRGSQRFTWAGYDVHITVPGKDHTPLWEFNIPQTELKKNEKGIGEKEFGRLVADHLETGTYKEWDKSYEERHGHKRDPLR